MRVCACGVCVCVCFPALVVGDVCMRGAKKEKVTDRRAEHEGETDEETN